MRALTLAVCALISQAAVATATGPSRDDRAQMRCMRALEREGLRYATQRGWGLMGCLRGLSDCTAQGASPTSRTCTYALRSCRALVGEMAEDDGRERGRIAEACAEMPVARVMEGLGYGSTMADCSAGSIGELVDCLNARLRKSEGEIVGTLKPSACALLAAAGLADKFPEIVCSSAPPECQPCDPCPPASAEGDACGGPQNVSCPEGFACDRADALCGASPMGTCVPLPASCTADGQPVCGCDGTTYPSDCDRLRAGVVRARVGACDPPETTCGLVGGDDCPPGSFCDFPMGICAEGQGGVCKPMRSEPCNVCSAFVDGPVCGCDSVTYASDCDRHAAGVSKYYSGACVF